MKTNLEHYGYSVRYMDLTGELYDETRKGFSSKEYAEKNLNALVSDLKAENEIIDARIHAYQALPQIIYVIGSRKFVSEIKQKQDEYSLRGYIVIDNTFDQENLNQLPSEIKNEFSQRIRQTGFFKIRIADLIYVVNKDGYIGEGTGEKILIANSLGKDIVYLEPIQ